MDVAGLSLKEEQKNFYDYLHFSPIKVRLLWLYALFLNQGEFLWLFALVPSPGDAFMAICTSSHTRCDFYGYQHFFPNKVKLVWPSALLPVRVKLLWLSALPPNQLNIFRLSAHVLKVKLLWPSGLPNQSEAVSLSQVKTGEKS